MHDIDLRPLGGRCSKAHSIVYSASLIPCMPQVSMSAALKGSVAAGCAARCNGAPVMRRKAISGQAVTVALPKRSLGRRGALLVRAFDDDDEEPREWPYPKYIQGNGPMQQLL